MAKTKIREPKQKRSIEKKRSIILASYRLFCEKGYYKTNTIEIAHEAGVSTGIVYSYFTDKKDILLDVIKHYIALLSEQIRPLLSTPLDKTNLSARIAQLFDILIASHNMNIEAHNEFLALSLLEKDIHAQFAEFEKNTLEQLYTLFLEAGYAKTDLHSKIRLSYGIIEHVSHDYIQQKISAQELKSLKSLTIETIINLFDTL